MVGAAAASAPRVVGPGLVVGMPEAEVVERLNGWGIARDGELRDLADNLAPTHAIVSETFDHARTTLLIIVVPFRQAAESIRLHNIPAAPANAHVYTAPTLPTTCHDATEAVAVPVSRKMT